MDAVTSADPGRQVVELLERELAAIACELAGHCFAADLAVARRDFDVVCASSEAARELAARWSALYRRLLALRVASTRPSEFSSR
jgi:hypothetical protein